MPLSDAWINKPPEQPSYLSKFRKGLSYLWDSINTPWGGVEGGQTTLGAIGGPLAGAIGNPSNAWNQINTPLSERYGIKPISPMRGPVDEIGNFALREGTRPLNYAAIFAPELGLAKIPLLGGALSVGEGPIAARAAMLIGLTAGSEIGANALEKTSFGKEHPTIAGIGGGLLGGLAGGGLAGGLIKGTERVLGKAPRKINASYFTDIEFEYIDPETGETGKLVGRLAPVNRFSEVNPVLTTGHHMTSLPNSTYIGYGNEGLKASIERAKRLGLTDKELEAIIGWNVSSDDSPIRIWFNLGTLEAERIYKAGQDFRDFIANPRKYLGAGFFKPKEYNYSKLGGEGIDPETGLISSLPPSAELIKDATTLDVAQWNPTKNAYDFIIQPVGGQNGKPEVKSIPRTFLNPDNTLTLYRGEVRYTSGRPEGLTGSIQGNGQGARLNPSPTDYLAELSNYENVIANKGQDFVEVALQPAELYDAKKLAKALIENGVDPSRKLRLREYGELSNNQFGYSTREIKPGYTDLGTLADLAPDAKFDWRLANTQALTGQTDPNIVESWSLDPQRASAFTVGQTKYVIKRDVPIEDIIAPIGFKESEVLVLNREKVDPALYAKITGSPLTNRAEATAKIPLIDRLQASIELQLQDNNAVRLWMSETGRTPEEIADKLVRDIEKGSSKELFTIQDQIDNANIPYSAQNVAKNYINQLNWNINQVFKDAGSKAGMGFLSPEDALLATEAFNRGVPLVKSVQDKAFSDYLDTLTPIERNNLQLAIEDDIAKVHMGQSPVTNIGEFNNPTAGLEQPVTGPQPINAPTELPPIASGEGGGIVPPPPTTFGGADDAAHFGENERIPRHQYTDPIQESAWMETNYEAPTFGNGEPVTYDLPPLIELQTAENVARANAGRRLSAEWSNLIAEESAKEAKAGHGNFVDWLNNILKQIEASLDASVFGIQAMTTLAHLIVNGRITDAGRVFSEAFTAFARPSIMIKMLNDWDTLAARNKWVLPDGKLANTFNLHQRGLHIAGMTDQFGEFGPSGLTALRPFERIFNAGGNAARLAGLKLLIERYGMKNIDELINGMNRVTGIGAGGGFYSSNEARLILFAPRFLQSQLESVVKASIDWRTVEGAIARRHLGSLMGLGTLLTITSNEARGYHTDYNPDSPNFMRIRDVDGVDISLFGPWDTLVRGVTKAVVHGDVGYIARSKASPLISTAWTLVTGKDFKGDPLSGTNLVKSMMLPFSLQDTESLNEVATVASLFGLKSSPLTPSELIDKHMEEAKLDPNDTLARREWLAAHPEDIPKATASDKQIVEAIKSNISDRRKMNDLEATSGDIPLSKWRANRTDLTQELRNKLEEGFKNNTPPIKNQQDAWIRSWYDLFTQARDPASGGLNAKLLDPLQAEWIAKNGQEAYDYVNRYGQVNKSEMELQYLSAVNGLKAAGYFSIPKYIRLRSQLTDDQIDKYRDAVSEARHLDPRLQSLSFDVAAQRYLSQNTQLSRAEVTDIINAGKNAFANPARTKIELAHPEWTIWFRPNATYANYLVAVDQANHKANIPQRTINLASPQPTPLSALVG